MTFNQRKAIREITDAAQDKIHKINPNYILISFDKTTCNTLTMDELLGIVSAVTGVSSDLIKSKTRASNVVKSRHLFIYVACAFKLGGLKSIGAFVGMADHSVALHGRDTTGDLIDTDDIRVAPYYTVIMQRVVELMGLNVQNVPE